MTQREKGQMTTMTFKSFENRSGKTIWEAAVEGKFGAVMGWSKEEARENMEIALKKEFTYKGTTS